MTPKFIISFCIIFYFLALVCIARNFLRRNQQLPSKMGMNFQQRRKIVLQFALIFGSMVVAIILLLTFFALPFISSVADELIFSSGEFIRKLSPFFVVTFSLTLLLVLIALSVTPRNWSRTRKGYVLLLIGFGLSFLSMLLRGILMNQSTPPSEIVIWLNMGLAVVPLLVFIIAAVMLSSSERLPKNNQNKNNLYL